MGNAVIAFAVLAVLMIGGRLLVARRRSASAPAHVLSADGAFALRTPRLVGVLLAALALIPAGVLGMFTLQAWRSGARGLPGAVAATVVAAAVAAYLLASAMRSRVVVRDTGMERVGVFRQRRIGWPAVAKIAYNPAQRWFFLTMADGSHLWLRVDVAGIGDFAGLALRRVKPEVLEAAGPDVREVLEELAEAARKEAGGR